MHARLVYVMAMLGQLHMPGRDFKPPQPKAGRLMHQLAEMVGDGVFVQT